MARNLVEAYKNRLAISESVYARDHNGEKMGNNKKMVVAKCLDNISNFMNEAFDSSTGTQRSDLGLFKKFCLNLTTVALPNLISHELVIVSPMSSMSGYITYIEYVAGSKKGQTENGDLFNNPFRLGDVDANYTSQAVVENVEAGDFVPAWTPVVGNKVTFVAADGTETEMDLVDGKVNITEPGRVKYQYDNIVIPQNDLPMLRAEMKSIPLIAKARRIAVYYSQIAAFQAKTDYGIDLGDQLAEKAVGQLSYEIDTEVTNLLIENAKEYAELKWSKTLPVGVSKSEHYEGFTEIVEIGRQKIYDVTKRLTSLSMAA